MTTNLIDGLKYYLQHPQLFSKALRSPSQETERKTAKVWLGAALNYEFAEEEMRTLMETVYQESLGYGTSEVPSEKQKKEAFIRGHSGEWSDSVNDNLYKISIGDGSVRSPLESPLPACVVANVNYLKKRAKFSKMLSDTLNLPGRVSLIIAGYFSDPSSCIILNIEHIKSRHDLQNVRTLQNRSQTRISKKSGDGILARVSDDGRRVGFTSYFPQENPNVAKLIDSSAVLYTSWGKDEPFLKDKQLLRCSLEKGKSFHFEAVHVSEQFLNKWNLIEDEPLMNRIRDCGLTFIKTAYPIYSLLRYDETQTMGRKRAQSRQDEILTKARLSVSRTARRGNPVPRDAVIRYSDRSRVIVEIAPYYFSSEPRRPLMVAKGVLVDVPAKNLLSVDSRWMMGRAEKGREERLEDILKNELEYKMPTNLRKKK